MSLLQFDAEAKELVLNLHPEDKRYNHLGEELHDLIFTNLACIFRHRTVLPDKCATQRDPECSFPMGWRIRRRDMGTDESTYYECDTHYNPDFYRDE